MGFPSSCSNRLLTPLVTPSQVARVQRYLRVYRTGADLAIVFKNEGRQVRLQRATTGSARRHDYACARAQRPRHRLSFASRALYHLHTQHTHTHTHTHTQHTTTHNTQHNLSQVASAMVLPLVAPDAARIGGLYLVSR